jgi:hypothetical protein
MSVFARYGIFGYLSATIEGTSIMDTVNSSMETQQPVQDGPQEPASFLDRAAGVFSSPSETFEELSTAPVRNSTWLFPLLLSIIISVVFVVAIFYNQSLRDQIIEQRMAEMQKQVSEGKIQQEQVDRANEAMESPVMFMLFGGISAVFAAAIAFFLVALFIWLGGVLFLKFGGGYPKVLEMYGLASLVGLAGAVVTLIMMNLFGSMYAAPAASMAVMNTFDHRNAIHNLLSAVNIFSIWQVAIVGIGLAKVSKRPTGSGMGVAFGLWGAWVIVSVALATLFGWTMR